MQVLPGVLDAKNEPLWGQICQSALGGEQMCTQNLLKSGPPPQNDQSRYAVNIGCSNLCPLSTVSGRGQECVSPERQCPEDMSGHRGPSPKKLLKCGPGRGSNLPKSRRPLTPLVPPGGRRVGAGCGGRAPSRRAGPTGAARHNKTAAEQAGNIKPKLRTVLSLCMSIVTEPCSLSGTAFIRLYRYQLSPVERNDTPPLSVVCSVLFTVPPRGVL
jgi:hypothetical protein